MLTLVNDGGNREKEPALGVFGEKIMRLISDRFCVSVRQSYYRLAPG